VKAEKELTSDQAQVVLEWSDEARDRILPELGKKLSDLPDGSYKISDWPLHQQKQEQKLRDAEELQKNEREAQLAKKMEESKIPPDQFFRHKDPELYSKFDSNGIPTHDADGEPLSKSARKKLQKILRRHTQKYEKAMQPTSD